MVEKKLEASGEENLASTACAQFAFGSKLVPFFLVVNSFRKPQPKQGKRQPLGLLVNWPQQALGCV